ncbi:hypothetical protein SETIT_3G073800v2 [Setaria italica]|uniref:Uncharacterized protein n=1 Tax=Setaria italica TaxID=4555 RepID=A0A368QCC6_SETIT|nr:hypothetical protein SETIT_3G073800v2 [Setaria italica]
MAVGGSHRGAAHGGVGVDGSEPFAVGSGAHGARSGSGGFHPPGSEPPAQRATSVVGEGRVDLVCDRACVQHDQGRWLWLVRWRAGDGRRHPTRTTETRRWRRCGPWRRAEGGAGCRGARVAVGDSTYGLLGARVRGGGAAGRRPREGARWPRDGARRHNGGAAPGRASVAAVLRSWECWARPISACGIASDAVGHGRLQPVVAVPPQCASGMARWLAVSATWDYVGGRHLQQ